IQPYLVAYFKLNDLEIDKNKEWLKEYITNVTILKDSNSNEIMMQLYCSSNNNNNPREGNVLSIVKDWPYRPIQADAQNCYMRSHNVGYRIRLGNVIYQWFRNQECKSFAFNKIDCNTMINEEKNNNENIMNENVNKVKGGNTLNVLNATTQINNHHQLKIPSKQLKIIEYEEMYNGIAIMQALVAKANINAIQNESFYSRDESTNQIYFELYLNLTERAQFRQFYQYKFPKLIQIIKEINQKCVQFYFDVGVFDCQLIPSLFPFFLMKKQI
ncbi:hypothetical protein RFI_05336, partial [Reticulomyxa filosa]